MRVAIGIAVLVLAAPAWGQAYTTTGQFGACVLRGDHHRYREAVLDRDDALKASLRQRGCVTLVKGMDASKLEERRSTQQVQIRLYLSDTETLDLWTSDHAIERKP